MSNQGTFSILSLPSCTPKFEFLSDRAYSEQTVQILSCLGDCLLSHVYPSFKTKLNCFYGGFPGFPQPLVIYVSLLNLLLHVLQFRELSADFLAILLSGRALTHLTWARKTFALGPPHGMRSPQSQGYKTAQRLHHLLEYSSCPQQTSVCPQVPPYIILLRVNLTTRVSTQT